jgi:hypothetical protein
MATKSPPEIFIDDWFYPVVQAPPRSIQEMEVSAA